MAGDERYSVIILAGGQGTRLGEHKASALLGGETLLARTARHARALTDDLLLVVQPGQPAPLGDWRLAHDVTPGNGLLAGLAGGLQAARYDWSLLIGCDMPFVSAELVSYLATLRADWQAVVPRCAQGLEPLHALYRRDILPPLYDALGDGERRVGRLLSLLDTLVVPEQLWLPHNPDRLSFFNVNTPADLAEARAWWAADHSR